MVRRGVTLLELLVSIGVIAVLLGIAAAALRPSVLTARSLTVLAVVRSVGQAAHNYAEDTGHWPHYAEPRLSGAFRNGGVDMPYFNQQWYWMLTLHPYIGDGEHVQNPEAYSPWHPLREVIKNGTHIIDGPHSQFGAGGAVANSIGLSTALFSGAAMWAPVSPTLDVSQLAPVGAAAVAFPSNKLMFYESVPYHLTANAELNGDGVPGFAGRIDGRWPVPAVMVDGSGRIVPPGLIPEPVLNPFYPGGQFSSRMLNTVNGFLGGDF